MAFLAPCCTLTAEASVLANGAFVFELRSCRAPRLASGRSSFQGKRMQRRTTCTARASISLTVCDYTPIPEHLPVTDLVIETHHPVRDERRRLGRAVVIDEAQDAMLVTAINWFFQTSKTVTVTADPGTRMKSVNTASTPTVTGTVDTTRAQATEHPRERLVQYLDAHGPSSPRDIALALRVRRGTIEKELRNDRRFTREDGRHGRWYLARKTATAAQETQGPHERQQATVHAPERRDNPHDAA